MYTAMLTVENIMGASHDVWSVNVEEEYHEEMRSGPSSGAPEAVSYTHLDVYKRQALGSAKSARL